MKGSWVTTFAVGGVIGLLTLFLGLQYNWLLQAGEAERERMQRRVEVDTKNFADDFNRELQAAFFNFQTDAAGWDKQDWTEFNERYDFWRSRTQYPELIRDFVYIAKGDKRPLRYDPQARGFVPAAIPDDLLAVKEKAEGDRYTPFYEDQSVLVMPVHETEKRVEGVRLRRVGPGGPAEVKMPERKGLLMIVLDRDVVTGRILPDLSAKHFPEGNFRVAVRNKTDAAVYEPAGALSGSDASAGLLGLTPDNMIFFTERAGVWSRMRSEERKGMVISEHIESRTFTHSGPDSDGTKTGTYAIQLKPGPADGSGVRARTTVFAGSNREGDPWMLNVQHTAGSVNALARNEFNKNFIIGVGVYALLVGAIVAIVLSALRSKRFAQRQIDFVSSVSHEFRTPLAVIFSAGENLADGVANDRDKVVRYGGLIKGEGRKLSAMVEQILQFAGARSGKKRYSLAETDVATVVASAVAECGPILEEKGIIIETAVDDELPAVNADSVAIATALQNLISNSIKYSNGSRWIKVSASNGDGTVKLSVEDRGIGIAADDLRHIFEPFYRSKNVVDAQIHGNGLGLALVKQIAEAHNGKVLTASELSKGSKFTIELPRR